MPVEPAELLLATALLAAVAVIAVLVRDRGPARRAWPTEARRAVPDEGSAARALLAAGDWLGIGLLRVGADGEIALANAMADALLRRPAGSLPGLSLMEAFVDHRIEELTRAATADGEAERELTFGGEPQRTLRLRARPDPAGGLWLALEDVSELRRLQRIRAEFVDNLSHELRTPLATVRLLVESLATELDRAPDSASVHEAVAKIDVETGHLAQMVGELLELARIEGGETRLRLEGVDLQGIVDEALERLRPFAERQQVELRRELPDAPAERTVTGDATRLGQLLANLVHNAIRFSPAGEEVVVRVRPGPTQTLIEVEDRGPGIPRAELERVFERFYKVDRSRQRGQGAPAGPGGTGLGLAIARHIVERHGGRVWAENRQDGGSRFTVALPKAELSGG